jgi:hypothetical protein
MPYQKDPDDRSGSSSTRGATSRTELALVLAAHAPTELAGGPAQLGQLQVLASHASHASVPVLGLLAGDGPDDPR